MVGGARVMVVMPAYNAEKTLAQTLGELPPGVIDEILLVDDASRDGTVAEA
jgi:glycosyltransferase involved in cell wall biosynthesis